jgi:hypothetical protein
MTLRLELTPEQEQQLAADAARMGIDTETYALNKLFPETPSTTRESIGERLRRHGILGAVEGKPRKDGRSWSEIEGFPQDID